MALNFSLATKQQLLTILNEDCPNHYKLQAAKELQNRKEKSINAKVTQFRNRAVFSGKAYRVTL